MFGIKSVHKHRITLLVFIFLSIYNYGQDEIYTYNDISTENKQYESGIDLNPRNLPVFTFNYNTLINYYKSIGIDFLEPGDRSFYNLNECKISINPYSVRLKGRVLDSTIRIDLPVSPESAQNLFSLNEEKYLRKYGGDDFLEAKKNYYSSVSFSVEKQEYSKKYYQLWDWKSLNYPPLKKLKHSLNFYDKNLNPIDYDTIQSPYFNPDFHKLLDKNTRSNLTFNNRMKILRNRESFQKKMELIKNAKSSIMISLMSYYNDSTSTLMTNELIKKTKEGVKVFLIVEKVWTLLLMKKAMRKFRNSNVVILYASDLINIEMNRTALFHNKIWVFDHHTAIVGGQNIIESENISSGYNHQNYDLDLLIEGPAVTDIAMHSVKLLKEYHFERKAPEEFVDFIENYEKELGQKYITETMKKLRGEEHYKELLSNRDTRMRGVCRFVIQGPNTDRYAVSKAYIFYFKKAGYLIDLTTGKLKIDLDNEIELSNYSGWSKRIWNQLFDDAGKGVRINMIYNGIDGGYGEFSSFLKLRGLKNYDNKKTSERYYRIAEKLDLKAAKRNYPFMSYLQKKDNFEVWNYFQYMHAKSWMIDRFVVSIGSFNLDNWSSDRSQESVLICQDKDLAREYELEYTLDRVNSTPVYVSD